MYVYGGREEDDEEDEKKKERKKERKKWRLWIPEGIHINKHFQCFRLAMCTISK